MPPTQLSLGTAQRRLIAAVSSPLDTGFPSWPAMCRLGPRFDSPCFRLVEILRLTKMQRIIARLKAAAPPPITIDHGSQLVGMKAHCGANRVPDILPANLCELRPHKSGFVVSLS